MHLLDEWESVWENCAHKQNLCIFDSSKHFPKLCFIIYELDAHTTKLFAFQWEKARNNRHFRCIQAYRTKLIYEEVLILPLSHALEQRVFETLSNECYHKSKIHRTLSFGSFTLHIFPRMKTKENKNNTNMSLFGTFQQHFPSKFFCFSRIKYYEQKYFTHPFYAI